jgi:hypothetical protein
MSKPDSVWFQQSRQSAHKTLPINLLIGLVRIPLGPRFQLLLKPYLLYNVEISKNVGKIEKCGEKTNDNYNG